MIKKILFQFTRIKPINIFAVGLFSFIKAFITVKPNSRINRIPVNKKFKVYCDDGNYFTFNSNGYDAIANSIYWSGFKYYESETLPVFIKLIQNSKVFFDIGSNTGLFSLVAKAVNRNIEIYAFEPEPRSYQSLCRNFGSNNKNIHLNDIAISSEDGYMEFHIGNSLTIPTGSSLAKDVHVTEKKVVKNVVTIRLDNFIQQNNVTGISLMKIDTEGAEFSVLSGAVETIKRFKPVILCEIFYNRSEEQIRLLLEKLDYVCYHLTDKGIYKQEKLEGDKTWKFLNYVFVNRSDSEAFEKELGVIY